MKMFPAPAGHGRIFRLKKEGGESEVAIKADVAAVCTESQLCTTLGAGPLSEMGARSTLATVEHLLSAAAGLGLTDVDIHVSGPGRLGEGKAPSRSSCWLSRRWMVR